MKQAYESTNYGGNAPGNYQRFFVPSIGRPVAEDLLAVAHLKPEERVLDVACGTGVVTRLAAERVGPQGRVTGLDLNPGMLEVARSSTPENQPIEWIEANAESMLLEDGAFDVVLCQMGLQFVPNKLAALREMRRVLAPGGRVYINLPARSLGYSASWRKGLRATWDRRAQPSWTWFFRCMKRTNCETFSKKRASET